MDLYALIIANKELLKFLYALIVVLICIVVVLKTHKLFRLSSHQGIRYFRNAFLFYGIGFAIRYFFGSLLFHNTFMENYLYLVNALFEYFLIMGGFFLLYSLLWKKIDPPEAQHFSSLFNPRIFIFYVMALVVVVLDYLWGSHCYMFFSQILVFACASIISYTNYKKKNKRYEFPKFYFLAMLLGFFAWTLNAIADLYFNWSQTVLINVYVLNLIFFLLFLYGVFRIIKSAK